MGFWAGFLAGFRRMLRITVRATLVAAAVLAGVGYLVGGAEAARNAWVWSLVVGVGVFLGLLSATVIDVQDREGPHFALDDWNHQAYRSPGDPG